MSFDEKHNRYCDECGRTIEKAHRFFQGKDYCSNCYPRVFPKAECTSCGGVARPHRYSNTPAICRECNIKTRTCLRCDKAVPRAGKVINGRPICPSCAPYFNEPQVCTSCGKSSQRLSRAVKFGLNNPMCQSCRGTLTHKTCGFCRKHRPVHGTTEDGKGYCASCIPGHQQHHSCPGCGLTLPGSGRSRCRSCLNLNRIVHEADLHSLTLHHLWAREILTKFAIWLHDRSGHQPNCFRIFVSHEPFFERLDAHFNSIADINETTLLDNLGVALIRQHLLASVFLQENLEITIRDASKIDSAERSRIRDKLVKNAREPWAPLLRGYHLWLIDKEISPRTQRLYLRAAEKFCQTEKVKADRAWEANAVYDFLKKHPGSRANLYKFVTYCRSQLGWMVEVPSRPASTSTSLPGRLKSLMKQVKVAGVEVADLELLSKLLALAFGYEHKEFVTSSWSLSEVEGTTILISNTEKIVVPAGYVDAIRSWTSRSRSFSKTLG